MNIRILAASDRNNYGDLLFPMVIKKYAETNFPKDQTCNYGIVKSNLKSFGAEPTKSLYDLKSDVKTEKEMSKIIVAGGEVLGAEWLTIYMFIFNFWEKLYRFRMIRSFFYRSKILNFISKITFGSSKPFVLDGDVYKKNKIYYNAVGALGVKSILSLPKYYKYFQNIQHMSVRDKYSQKHFSNAGVQCSLSPDSALIMSDLFVNELITNITSECKELVQHEFVFVQLGKNKGPENINKFVKNLTEFSINNKIKIVLCPIGFANGHEDEIILKKVYDLNKGFLYYTPQNVFEIMYLIQNAKLYLGTSLHGLITAQSFNVPYFVFHEKVDKIKNYIETWNTNPKICYGSFYNFNKIQERFISYDKAVENEITKIQKNLVYANFKTIFSA